MAFQIVFLCVISGLAFLSAMASSQGIAHDLKEKKSFEKE